MCNERDGIIVLKKDDVVWSEPTCQHPEHWTPNCIVLGVVYDNEPDQEIKVQEIINQSNQD